MSASMSIMSITPLPSSINELFTCSGNAVQPRPLTHSLAQHVKLPPQQPKERNWHPSFQSIHCELPSSLAIRC